MGIFLEKCSEKGLNLSMAAPTFWRNLINNKSLYLNEGANIRHISKLLNDLTNEVATISLNPLLRRNS
jgi:hypothetical protein